MPRFFFHRTDGGFDPDHDGTELPDLLTARLEAVRFAAGTVQQDPDQVWNGGIFRVEVTDEARRLLCTVLILSVDAPAARGLKSVEDDGRKREDL